MKQYLIFAILILSFGSASAVTGVCLEAYVSSINPSSVSLNEEFTVGILIDSCGDVAPDNVSFEIIQVSPDISVKESLKNEFGSFGFSNSERFITYNMKTSSSAKPGNYDFRYKLSYSSKGVLIEKTGVFSVTVIAKEAKINIASVKTKPVLPYLGDNIELSLRIENYGEGNANSLRVKLSHDFIGTKESFIGTLDSKEDGPAVFTFIPGMAGEFKIPVEIIYKDDFGEHFIHDEVSLIVLEKDKNYFGIILSSVFALIVFGLLFFNYKTRKTKDKIIHQLLREKQALKK